LRFEAKVRERIVRTPDIISIRFDRAAGFEYMPGQYIFVTIYSGDEKMTKHLTISSSPTEPDHLEVTKRLTGHPYSNALSELREGDKVTLDGPFGSGGFTFTGEYEKLLLLTGGIGVTPFRSMIRYCVDKCLKTDIVLIYSNRYEWDIAFREEFDEIQRLNGNFRVVYTVTRPTEGWSGPTGRVDAGLIRREAYDCHERVAYVSGPQLMVDEMVDVLRYGLGMSEDSVRYQYFTGYEDVVRS
jgi:ferredoxin-NADP reductase